MPEEIGSLFGHWPESALAAGDLRPIREGLAKLPHADNVKPGQQISLAEVYTPPSHRSALDPERTLVVGNRGMGKSFWAHALENQEIRERAVMVYRQPRLRDTTAVIGFDGSDRAHPIAPNRDEIAAARTKGIDAEDIWRTVLIRAVESSRGRLSTEGFIQKAMHIGDNRVDYASLLTRFDDQLAGENKLVLVMFDALDRLGDNWSETRDLTRGLLRRALAARSYRAIRFKLFIRSDQFADNELFNFPDASKIKNDRVDLEWPFEELYGLLFHYLERDAARDCFRALKQSCGIEESHDGTRLLNSDVQKCLVDRIAGEHMGASAKRGRVYSWVPQHLADAKGETAPRTFLTAWREAAYHGALPRDGRAVDHLGINEGVRRASKDRLAELKDDYDWISEVLEPLRDDLVPMEKRHLEQQWTAAGTIRMLRKRGEGNAKAMPIALTTESMDALLETLQAIGVFEVRSNGKINVPDIFRVEAGIKRKGGVKPPVRRG
jgi:hypothetical protein